MRAGGAVSAMLLAALAAAPGRAALRAVRLEPPRRDFGYFLGDVMTARAVILSDPATRLDAATLPAPGPVNTVLSIRGAELAESVTGGVRRTVVSVTYQNFFAPQAATSLLVPGFTLVFRDGERRFLAAVPAWSVLVSALRHDLTPMTDIRGLRPDHAVPPEEPGGARLRLFAALAVALAAFGAWLWARAGRVWPGRRPFARAARQVARAARRAGAGREGMLALHRAFDAASGRAMLAGDVADFVARHERFAPLRGEIEQFFAVSSRVFFGAEESAADTAALAALGRKLRAAEAG